MEVFVGTREGAFVDKDVDFWVDVRAAEDPTDSEAIGVEGGAVARAGVVATIGVPAAGAAWAV